MREIRSRRTVVTASLSPRECCNAPPPPTTTTATISYSSGGTDGFVLTRRADASDWMADITTLLNAIGGAGSTSGVYLEIHRRRGSCRRRRRAHHNCTAVAFSCGARRISIGADRNLQQRRQRLSAQQRPQQRHWHRGGGRGGGTESAAARAQQRVAPVTENTLVRALTHIAAVPLLQLPRARAPDNITTTIT